ncbi:UDP-glucosyltransferase 2-like [Pectinophora gossypiella]|uniref:UDP-glucosyltransferase 2-like n=1 Tax=Pectinophora gossypiella TaxID=13191 RepID=UPI00214E7058|nr:UDP-glucosyltransferase 2-like [Pectinophora gossypiella]
MLVYLIMLCAILAPNCETARILAVFPIPSISHQVVFRSLTQELAKRGHEVVVITTDPVFPKGKAPANLTEIDVHDTSYKIWRDSFLKLSKGKKADIIEQMETGFDVINNVIDYQLSTKEVKEIVQGKQHFDLIFVEAIVRPALAFSHVYKAPVIMISSFGAMVNIYNAVGGPTHPIWYPMSLRQRLYNLTLWEKVNELYLHYKFLNFINNHQEKEHAMLVKHFGEDLPSISELQNNIDMLFLNIHPIFEGNYPVPPGVVHVWGIHQKAQKELPQDLKSYLDSSKHGVIYISFGTNVDPANLPPETIQMFIRVLSKLPYDVLWKWNTDELPGRTPNIRISKWFPQSDLLKHPKIKLFITQGGLQSTDEAITAGVPLVGIPMLGDQWYNTEKYVHLKIGIRLNAESVTEDEFRNAINNVIEDESYRKNIKKLNELVSDQPDQPLERAVWWTEYVLRHSGAKHLRSPAANISLAEYFQLEFFSILLIGFLIIASLASIVLYKLYRFYVNQVVNVKLKNN